MSALQLLSRLHEGGAVLRAEQGQLQIDAPDALLDEAMLALIGQHKAAILSLLATLDSATAPVRQERPGHYEAPTSLAQQRMLFMEELAGNASYYNMPFACRIRGPLDRAKLCAALGRLVDANDVLRTVYPRRAQGRIQQVLAPGALAVIDVDLSAAPEREAALRAQLRLDADHVFDLERDIPVRATLIALGAAESVLSLNIHHVAADGWSARKIFADIGLGYGAATGPARDWQYADYVQWQRGWLASGHCQAARDYWVDRLQGAPQLHSLPTDFIRPAIQSVAGDTCVHPLPAGTAAALERCARQHQSTPFVVLQAVFAALLARYSGEQDIVFGTAVANRQPAAFIDTVGLFVNTLVLRYAVGDALTFKDLVGQAARHSVDAMRHQQMPFDLLVDELQPARSLGYNPLVQIMLVMQDGSSQTLVLPGLEVETLAQRQQVSKFDLALHVHTDGDAIALHWEYSSALFKRSTIAAMADHFTRLLDACLQGSEQGIASIALVDEAQCAPVDTASLPVATTIDALFASQAARRPDALALCDGEQRISYGELDRRAELLAGRLYAAVGPNGGNIGVCMERSVELVVCMLAIFKIGAIYVPLDPHYPAQRLDFMIEDAQMTVVLASEATALPPSLAASDKLLYVEALLAAAAPLAYRPATDVDAPAYVIYTSGSTGKPKGVLVTHANLYHSLHANRALMQFGEDDRMPTVGSQAFGVSLLEILLPLSSGGQVRLLKKAQVADVEALVRASADATVLHAVPSLMRQWLDALENGSHADPYPQLRLLLVGGEPVPGTLLRRIEQWRPGIRLLALYGMTECAIICSSFAPGERAGAHYCIGTPFAHLRFHVLNRQGQAQPPGVPGELHIGGMAVAQGYLGQPQLTAERFVAHPRSGERLYKTGDRARRLEDGNYEFMGRVDHQVSLRGARIELGEIETLAGTVDGVKQAVAHIADLGQEEQTLVLYYTASEGAAAGLADTIRTCLSHQLPDYMRPSIIARLDAFPLNPNGKVDRKHLPAPTIAATLAAPATAIETRLLALWQAVLQREEIGVTDSFFDLGGHSLMASKLVAQIRAEFAVAFPLSDVFAAPTIRACAALVERALREQYAASLIGDAEAGPSGDEMII